MNRETPKTNMGEDALVIIDSWVDSLSINDTGQWKIEGGGFCCPIRDTGSHLQDMTLIKAFGPEYVDTVKGKIYERVKNSAMVAKLEERLQNLREENHRETELANSEIYKEGLLKEKRIEVLGEIGNSLWYFNEFFKHYKITESDINAMDLDGFKKIIENKVGEAEAGGAEPFYGFDSYFPEDSGGEIIPKETMYKLFSPEEIFSLASKFDTNTFSLEDLNPQGKKFIDDRANVTVDSLVSKKLEELQEKAKVIQSYLGTIKTVSPKVVKVGSRYMVSL